MQFVDTDLLTALRASARDIILLYEIYPSDYDISSGFNPLDALERFAGQTYSFTHLSETVEYRREVPADFDLKIDKTVAKKLNSASIRFSNVSRYMSDFILSTDVQGLRFVVRAISRSIADPIFASPNAKSVVVFVGRLERPDGFTRTVGTISAKPDLGNIEAQVPPRDFELVCPLTFKGEECLGTETLSEKSTAYQQAIRCNKSKAQCLEYENTEFRQGMDIVQIESSFLYKSNVSFWGKVLNALTPLSRTKKIVGNSIFNRTPFGNPIPLILGRVSKMLIPLQYRDTGETIWFKMAAGRGPISDFVNIKSHNENFSQPLEITKHLGEYGGEGTQTADTVFPGGNFLSRLAYITGRVIGSDRREEDPAPDVTAVVAGITVRMYNDVQPSATGKLAAGVGGVTTGGSRSTAPGTPEVDYDTAVLGDEPEAYWKLEATSLSVIHPNLDCTDSSGNSHHGTLNLASDGVVVGIDGPIETDPASFGMQGPVARVPATGPTSGGLTPSGTQITLEAWAIRGSTGMSEDPGSGAVQVIMSHGGDTANTYMSFGQRSTGNFSTRVVLSLELEGDEVYQLNSQEVSSDVWHHIVGVRDGSFMGIWVDGCLSNSRNDLPAESVLAPESSAWRLGYFTNFAFGIVNFSCGLSHVAMYNHAQSSERIAVHYASGVVLPTGCPGVDWTDNPVDHARFLLTDPAILNNSSSYIDDLLSAYTAAYNTGAIKDETNAERCLIPNTESANAGTAFKRYHSTGLLGPLSFESTRSQIPAGVADREPEYEAFDPDSPPTSLDVVTHYRKRYTGNLELKTKSKALDVLYDVIFPTFRGFLKWNPKGQTVIDSERPADHTFLLAAAVPTDTTIQVRDALPWKNRLGSPYLLEGKVLIGVDLDNSEVRSVTGVTYSTAGNSITLAAAASGGPSAVASGASLAGGSTTVQASGTVTITGSLTPDATITVTIDGIDCVLTLVDGESSSTMGLRVAAVINADPVLREYVEAHATDNVVTVYAKVGVLTLSSALQNNHYIEIANPTTAPAVASSSGALAAGIYLVAYAYRNPNGTTEISEISAITVTSSKKIDVTGLGALPAGATSADWFISRSANSTDLGFVANNNGSAFSINSLPLTTADSAPTINSSGEEVLRVMMSFADRALTYADTTRANILKDTFTWPEGSDRSEINQIKLKHLEAIQDFAEQPLTVNDTPHQERMRKVNVQEVDLTAVDNYNQAARLGNGMLNTIRDGDFFFSWGAIGEALLLEEADVVCVSHDSGGSNGFRNKPVRLKTLKINKIPEITLGGREYKTIHYGDLIATMSEGVGGSGSVVSPFVPSTNPNFDAPPDISFNATDFPPNGLVQATTGTAGITSIRGGAVFGPSSFGQYAKVGLIKRAGVTVDEIINSDLRPNSDMEGVFEFIASAEGLYTVELEVCNNRNQCNATKPTASIVIVFGSQFALSQEDGDPILQEDEDFLELEH